MKATIQCLEQRKAWLEQAIPLLEEGTLDSLFQYFKTGYQSGNWHFPSMAVNGLYEAEEMLANQVNELLPSPFFLDREKTKRTGRLVLYYQGFFPIMIGSLNPHTQTFRIMHDTDEMIMKWEVQIEQIEEEIKAIQHQQTELQGQIETIRRAPFFSLPFYLKTFGWNREKQGKSRMNLLQTKETEVKAKKEEIEEEIHRQLQIRDDLLIFMQEMQKHGFFFDGCVKEKGKTIYLLYGYAAEKHAEDYQSWKQSHPYALHLYLPLIGVDSDYMDISNLQTRTSHRVRFFETLQQNFFDVVRYASQESDMRLESVVFHLPYTKENQGLNHEMDEAIHTQDYEKMLHLLEQHEEEGMDVQEIHFHYRNLHFVYHREGKVIVKGKSIRVREILRMKPIQILSGKFKYE